MLFRNFPIGLWFCVLFTGEVFFLICYGFKHRKLAIKVQIFWEGHKKLAHLPLLIWHYLIVPNCKWKMDQICVVFSEYPNFKLPTPELKISAWKFEPQNESFTFKVASLLFMSWQTEDISICKNNRESRCDQRHKGSAKFLK